MGETDIPFIRKIIGWSGINPFSGKWGINAFIYVLVLTFLIINSIFFIVYKWDDGRKRIEGVKALVLYLMCVAYFLGFTSHWDETISLVEMIENGLYKYLYCNTKMNIALKQLIETDIVKLCLTWKYMLIVYEITVYVAAPVVLIFRLIQNSASSITVELLHTNLPFYYPENYETITMYIIAYLLQCYLFTTGALKGYVLIISAFNAMQMIQGELMLLRQSLEEFDSIIALKIPNVTHEDSVSIHTKTMTHSTPSSNLSGFLKYFHQHHNHILRNVNKVTRGMQMIAFSVNSGMSMLICTSIYSLVMTDDVIMMLGEAIYSSLLILCIYCYGLMGEKISTQDEKLRSALYEYAWVDKPQWFRRSFLLIMTRTTRTIEMKSAGLFALNLRNFLATLQAVYSYFNILSSLR